MIKSYKLQRTIADVIIYVFLAVLGVIWVSPLVWLVLHSFRAEGGVTVPYVFPKEYTLDNYKALFTNTQTFDYPRWFLNTFVVAVFSCIISSLSVLMVSYTFSRLRFKSRKMFINIGMVLGMFPGFMTMIALYLSAILQAQVLDLLSRRASSTRSRERLTRLQLSTVLPEIRSSGRSFFLCRSLSLFILSSLHLSDRGATLSL